MAQHLNFVHTCEFFGLLSFGFAIIYYAFGHYPTINKNIVEMEEFKENGDPRDIDNQLQLDTERSGEQNTDTHRDKFRSNHHPVFNDTIETLDE